MPAPFVVHMIAGAIAIVVGFLVLFARKGAPLHRKGGVVFTVAMLVLAVTGTAIAIWKGDIGSVIGGSLATYLVSTGFITMRPSTPAWTRALIGAASIAAAITILSLVRATMAFPRTGAVVSYLVFATVSLLALRGDMRVLRGRVLTGAPRLTRHLWRMCMALWIATASFFLGPSRRVKLVLPDALVITPVLAIPVLLVLATMGYWLWRLRRPTGLRRVTISERPS